MHLGAPRNPGAVIPSSQPKARPGSLSPVEARGRPPLTPVRRQGFVGSLAGLWGQRAGAGRDTYDHHMPVALAVLPSLTLAVVLLGSGIAKLRSPDDLDGWRDLGVPDLLLRAWLVKLHPWAEIVLGLAVAVLGSWLGVLAGLAILGLMLAYTWLIWEALRKPEDTSCACFGEPTTITRSTLVRNVWLVGLAALTTVVIGSTPLIGGAVAELAAESAWWWLIGAVIAVGTTVVVREQGPVETPVATTPEPLAGEVLDYYRTRTPAVPVTLADGSTQTLRELSATRPVLLLAVSETCGACQPVLDKVTQWREVLPELDVRLLLMAEPVDTGLTEVTHPQSLHDVHGWVRQSFEEWGTPTAVLLGVDGLLAGGPVSGSAVIADFVADVRSQLDGH